MKKISKPLTFVLCLLVLSVLFQPCIVLAETVVLLHGIAKTGKDMNAISSDLKKKGYKILNITYPSTKSSITGSAVYLRKNYLTDKFWDKSEKVHIVTHSMGGLVARRYLDIYKNKIPKDKLGRVVMIAPPNGGSEVADLIGGLLPYQLYYGPAGDELTTDVQSRNKSDVYYDLGIISGTKEWPYFVAMFVMPSKSDGRVTVENTKLEGMKDNVTVNGTHTFIMKRKDTRKYIIEFLKYGRFKNE